jgi:hypothetical protein
MISEATYGSNVYKLLYVIVHGSFSSPILWALLNQLIVTAHGEKFECIKVVSVDNSQTDRRPVDSFIDDTTTGVILDDTAREPVLLEDKDMTTDEIGLI